MDIRIETPPGNVVETPELFAWLSVDEQGREGIVALDNPPRPMVSGTIKLLEAWRPFVEEVAKKAGRDIILVKFTRAEVVEIIKGTGD